MGTIASIHIDPCNIETSEAHNLRTAEYMANIKPKDLYIRQEWSKYNTRWETPSIKDRGLKGHYEFLKRLVKEKTGRAMQEKTRFKKVRGRLVEVPGAVPIREGCMVIKFNTTLDEVVAFGKECQKRWGITPLQVHIHKDEGYMLPGKPEQDDHECIRVGEQWFKPNLHAHIVFDWINHETGKSFKLSKIDMVQMQSLAADMLTMQRGISKEITNRDHQKRNDFVIANQTKKIEENQKKIDMQQQQLDAAKAELKKTKKENGKEKIKKTFNETATGFVAKVGALLGTGDMKDLERANEALKETNNQLQEELARQEEQHQQEVSRFQQQVDQTKDEVVMLDNKIKGFQRAFKWDSYLEEKFRFATECQKMELASDVADQLIKGQEIPFSGPLRTMDGRRFLLKDVLLKAVIMTGRIVLTINKQPLSIWIKEQLSRLQKKQGPGLKR